jgi:beta-N-acetylhexosaminidase
MSRPPARRLVIASIGLAAAACAARHQPAPAGSPAPRQAASAASRATNRWADSVLGTLTLRQKAAQLVWPSLLGDYVATDALAWRKLAHAVADEGVGGLLVSVGSPDEIAIKLNALQRIAAVPLLVASDLEYGAGQRARGGYFLPNAIDLGGATVFPPAMAFGAARDTTLAYGAGRITAIEGRALGIHVDFAPDLDVNNNAANPVINTRSYGEDPHLVAAMGRAFIRGVQDNGMVATGKHFPGHGDTETNSHLALPVVAVPRARLDSVELVPFRAAVAAGVGAIMSFHGSMPALDPSGAPGTLSSAVLTALLRTDLGFEGLVVSDAMDMHGVVDRYGAVESVKRAIAAGADVLIQPVDVTQAIDAIVAGVQEGRYPESRLDASVRRVLALKHTAGLDRRRLVEMDSLRVVVGDSAHLALSREVAERSITVVKDSLRALPLGRLPHAARVLSVTIARRADLGAGVAFAGELRKAFPALRAEYVDADDPGDVPWRILHEADSADVTIVGSYVGQSWDVATVSAPAAVATFVQQLVQRGTRPIVVAFGNPYLLQQVPSVPAYVVAWGGLPVSQLAAARAILGAIPVTGQLPISIPPYAARGAGLAVPAIVSAGAPR